MKEGPAAARRDELAAVLSDVAAVRMRVAGKE
jgi:hypothetical protein